MGVGLNEELVLLDLFSGIGGFPLGLEKSGFTFKKHYFSEIEKHPIANYKHNFKNAEYLGSVVDIDGNKLQRPNIITFGSPCQDFSLAGKRKGMEGERSGLIMEAIRLISETKPDIFIWENVKGTFSSNNGADFWAILNAFTNIGGYRLEWQLLNTKWFLPQNRERIYLVGHLAESKRGFGKIFPIGSENENIIETQQTQNQLASTICAGYGKIPTDGFYVKSNTKKGFEKATEGDSINYINTSSKTRRGRVGKGVAQTLDTASNQAVVIAQRGRNGKQELEKRTDGVTNSLTSVQKDNYLEENSKIRRLTEIECERLQGFPDDWTKYGYYDGEIKEIASTNRYKAIGNAVTVKVVEEIGKKLLNQ